MIFDSILLNLSNLGDEPKVWNVGGGNLNIPTVKRTVATLPQGSQPKSSSDIYIGTAQETDPNPVFIPNASERTADDAVQQTALQEVEKANAQLATMPMRVNKIKVYTNRVEQLTEQFAYYQQTSSGTYERQPLNIIGHYDPIRPKALVEIGPDFLGTIILDGNRRIEVKSVLPRTILTIELIFEMFDPAEQLPGHQSMIPSPATFLTGEEDPSEENRDRSPDNPDESPEKVKDPLLEPEKDSIVAFVREFAPYTRKAETFTQVPPLFALGQAALETGWRLTKPGNNLFGIKAGTKWQSATVTVPKVSCIPSGEPGEQEIAAPNQPCGNQTAYEVKVLLRAYLNPYRSVLDHGTILNGERYQAAFDFTQKPYAFAQAVVKAKYSDSDEYGKNLSRIMQLIEPHLKNWERQHETQKRAEWLQKQAFLASATVLSCVLIFVILKPLLLKKLVLI